MDPSAQSARDKRGLRAEAEQAAAQFPALMIEAERVAHTVAAGLHGRRRAGPGETFWQHRAYGFGDPVNAIDWRQSARSAARLYVRQNEWEAAAAVWLWRDPSASLDYASSRAQPTKRRRADVVTLALAILLAEAGERVGLLGIHARAFHGRAAPSRILEALAAPTEKSATSAPPDAGVPSGARVVLISDFFEAPGVLDRAVTRFAAAGATGALVQVVDPAEEDFPFSGRTEFCDPESRDRLLFGDAASLRAAYRARFAAHREAVAAIASRFGWTLIAHRADLPAQSAVLALYVALSDQRAA
jgi:uncharacterized protein (DUF58 family)